MFEKFTDRARKVMHIAKQEAQRLGHETIGTEHILMGLAREASGVAAKVLKRFEVDFRKVREQAEQLAPAKKSRGVEKIPLSPAAKRVVEAAQEEARVLEHTHIGTEHLLLGLLSVQEGVAHQVMSNLGLRLDEVRQEIMALLGHPDPASVGDTTKEGGRGKMGSTALEIFSENLTERAKQGKIEPLIGHREFFDAIIQVLACLHRNRLLIVADSPVWQQCVLHELARKLVEGTLPDLPALERVVKLDLPLLVCRTEGFQALERLRMVLNEASQANVLLLVTHVGLLFENSTSALGTLLTAWLRQGTRPLVVAVTSEEYRALKSAAPGFVELFELLALPEPTGDDTLGILRIERERLANHHKVSIREEALMKAVAQCNKPEGALNLLDRAAARVRLRIGARAPGVRDLDIEINRLEKEKEVAVAESHFEKAAKLRDEAEQLKNRREDIVQVWSAQSKESSDSVDEDAIMGIVDQLKQQRIV